MYLRKQLTQILARMLVVVIFLLSMSGCQNGSNGQSGLSNAGGESDVTSSLGDDSSVIKIEEYGAVANDGKDDANSLRRAIKAASNRGPGTTVLLSSGTYNISTTAHDTPNNTFHTIYLSDIHGVTIQGNNTTLMVDDPFMDIFYFQESSDITIKGITIDYAIDPWVQGTVTDVNKAAGTFTLSVSNVSKSGTTILDDPRWIEVTTSRSKTSPFGMVRDDNDPRLLKKGVPNFFYGFTTPKKVKQGVYEIGFTNNEYKNWLGTNIAKGSKIVLLNRIDSVGAFRFLWHKGDITVENCNVYASVGTIFCIGTVDGNLTINNVKAMIKPDSGRWLTSNADGCYLHDIKGSVTVTNCTFEGLSDDGMNIFTSGYTLNQVLSSTQIKIIGRTMLMPKVGEKITIVDPINGTLRGEANVTACEISSNDAGVSKEISATLTFDTPIDGMTSGTSRTDGDVVINQSIQAPGTTITNNVFRYGRAKGVKLAIRNGKLRGNTFENLGSAAVNLHDIPALSELSGAVNVLIENNKITNSGYLLNTSNETSAAITISAMRVDYAPSLGYIHSGIDIKNNTISTIYKHGIYINSAQYIRLENNIINNFVTGGKTTGMSGVTCENVNQVQIKYLTIDDPKAIIEGGIRLLQGCNSVVLEENKFSLGRGSAEVFRK